MTLLKFFGGVMLTSYHINPNMRKHNPIKTLENESHLFLYAKKATKIKMADIIQRNTKLRLS